MYGHLEPLWCVKTADAEALFPKPVSITAAAAGNEPEESEYSCLFDS